MKYLFIRHSLAVEREEFLGHDFDRPLSEKGVKRAKKFFKEVKKIYPDIDYIITSNAKRALQTAEILKNFYPKSKFIKTAKLLPGAGIKEFKETVANKNGILAIVAHQPDIEEIIKSLMYAPNLKIKLSKPSLVEIEENILKALISYKHLKGCE